MSGNLLQHPWISASAGIQARHPVENPTAALFSIPEIDVL